MISNDSKWLRLSYQTHRDSFGVLSGHLEPFLAKGDKIIYIYYKHGTLFFWCPVWHSGSMTFFYLGMVTMLPWNFLISINAFWNYKFRQVDNDTTEINQTTLAFMEKSVYTSIWIILRNLTLSVGNCQDSYLFHQMHTTKTESTNLQIYLFTFLKFEKRRRSLAGLLFELKLLKIYYKN